MPPCQGPRPPARGAKTHQRQARLFFLKPVCCLLSSLFSLWFVSRVLLLVLITYVSYTTIDNCDRFASVSWIKFGQSNLQSTHARPQEQTLNRSLTQVHNLFNCGPHEQLAYRFLRHPSIYRTSQALQSIRVTKSPSTLFSTRCFGLLHVMHLSSHYNTIPVQIHVRAQRSVIHHPRRNRLVLG